MKFARLPKQTISGVKIGIRESSGEHSLALVDEKTGAFPFSRSVGVPHWDLTDIHYGHGSEVLLSALAPSDRGLYQQLGVVAQSIEQVRPKNKVDGSIPSNSTNFKAPIPSSSPDQQTGPTEGRATRTVHGISPTGLADSIRSSGLTTAIQSNNRDVDPANYRMRCTANEHQASIFAPPCSAAMNHYSHSRQIRPTFSSPN